MRATKKRRWTKATCGALGAGGVAACGGSGGGHAGGEGTASAEGLAQFASCDDLRAAIIEDARQKITVQAAQLRKTGFVPIPVFTSTPGGIPTPAPGGAAGGPREFTDTN